jgi:hypothetical protein
MREHKQIPEILQARRILQDNAMAADLEQIRQVHPELKAANARELGSRFFALMATGVLDPVTAYEAVLAYEKRHAAPEAPPVIGAVAGTGGGEKEFYTPEEVDRLSSRQLKDKKTLDRIIRSMTKW